jgi:acyl carrier protein
LRLREDLNVGSLALVSASVDLCDRFGVDPAALDLGSFIDRAESVGDLIGIVDELRAAQAA